MRNNLFITVLLVCITITVQAQTVEVNKRISRSFKVKPETNIQIYNKYGNIHIVPEETDSVRMEVEIKVSNKKPDKATAQLENISIEFNESPYYIIAKTAFADFKGSMWSDISDRASTSISGGNKVEINWIVYVPKETELKVENKFGNVYTTNHTGIVTFDISYGDFQANELSGPTKLNVEFGSVHLKQLMNAKIDFSNVEVEVKKAIKLDVISRSSKWNIPYINELNLDSKHDKFYSDTVEVLKGEATFSNIKIGYVKKDVMFKMKYGNVNFETIPNSLRYFNLNATSADVFLMLQDNFNAKFSLNYRKALLSLPDFINAFPKDTVNAETQEFQTKGIIGTENPDIMEMKISLISGSITVGKK